MLLEEFEVDEVLEKKILQMEIGSEIMEERDRQDAMHNNQGNSVETWYLILAEEVGEVAQAILDRDLPHTREELIQVAAVAVAIVEAIDDGRV